MSVEADWTVSCDRCGTKFVMSYGTKTEALYEAKKAAWHVAKIPGKRIMGHACPTCWSKSRSTAERGPRVDPGPGDIVVGAADFERAEVIRVVADDPDFRDLGEPPYVEAKVRRDRQLRHETMSLETWRRAAAAP